MGRLPEAWIAPPATRELRGWVRHRAELVGLRSKLKMPGPRRARRRRGGGGDERSVRCGRAAVLADDRASFESRARVDSALRISTALDFEIELFARLVAGRLRADPGYAAIQEVPGVGPLLGAVFVAEIGDIGRFHRARPAGVLGRVDPETPRVRHHRPPRPDHQTGLPAGPLGGGRGRATCHRQTRLGPIPGPGRRAAGPQHRRRRRRPGADHFVFSGLRDRHIRCPPASRGAMSSPRCAGGRGRAGHDPRPVHRFGVVAPSD